MTKLSKFKTFVIVLLAIVAIAVAVIYFLDIPVVEEGAEPTMPQKILILAKKKLGFILGALGVSATAFIGFCFFVNQTYDGQCKCDKRAGYVYFESGDVHAEIRI